MSNVSKLADLIANRLKEITSEMSILTKHISADEIQEYDNCLQRTIQDVQQNKITEKTCITLKSFMDVINLRIKSIKDGSEHIKLLTIVTSITEVCNHITKHFMCHKDYEITQLTINTAGEGYLLQQLQYNSYRLLKLQTIDTILHSIMKIIDQILHNAILIAKHIDIDRDIHFGHLTIRIKHSTTVDSNLLFVTMLYNHKEVARVKINFDIGFTIRLDNKPNCIILYSALIDSYRTGQTIELYGSQYKVQDHNMRISKISFVETLNYEIHQNKFKARFIDSINDVAYFGGVYYAHVLKMNLQDNPFITNAATYVFQNMGRTFDVTMIEYTDLCSSFKLRKAINIPADDERKKIPQVDIYQDTSFSLDSQIKMVSDSSDVTKEISATAKVGLEYGLISGSLSTTYKQVNQVKTKTDSTVVMTKILCKVGSVRLKDYINLGELFDIEFQHAIADLAKKQDYEDFIAKYGTHYISEFTLGGLGNSIFTMTSQDVEELSETKTEVSASIKYYVASASASASASSKSEVKKFSKDVKLQLAFFGGKALPQADSEGILDYSHWISTLFEAPTPISIVSKTLASLLTLENFPNIANIDEIREKLILAIRRLYPDIDYEGDKKLKDLCYIKAVRSKEEKQWYINNDTGLPHSGSSQTPCVDRDTIRKKKIRPLSLVASSDVNIDTPRPNEDIIKYLKDRLKNPTTKHIDLSHDNVYYLTYPAESEEKFLFSTLFTHENNLHPLNIRTGWLHYTDANDCKFRIESVFGDLSNGKLKNKSIVKMYAHCSDTGKHNYVVTLDKNNYWVIIKPSSLPEDAVKTWSLVSSWS